MILGWTARETEQHSLWELVAAIDGHNRANGGDAPLDPPTDAEMDALLEAHYTNQSVH